MKSKEKQSVKQFLNIVEHIGNKLPHPVTMFIILCAAVVILSEVLSILEVSVEFEKINTADGSVSTSSVFCVSLFNADGLRYILTNAVKNFIEFAPLGSVLTAMLGVAVADGTGLISTALRKIVVTAPSHLITFVVVFAGIISNLASDVGYVILIPLGGMIFHSVGRHPIAGISAAFAGVSGGFSANLLLSTLDPMLSGLTSEAASVIDPFYSVSPACNWYFIIVSTFIITIIGSLVTEKIVEPRLGEYNKTKVNIEDITASENKGLIAAGITAVIYTAIIFALCATNVLTNQTTGSLIENSPFMDSIVTLVALFFIICGLSYGVCTGKFRSDKDVVETASAGMAALGGYLVLAFFSAQFVNYFSYTNIGTIAAVKGAEILKTTGFTGLPLIIAFIFLCSVINLFMGSASAKWAIMAPIFVPMFMSIGLAPELTQIAYRIGDSVTNIISPLMSYFSMIIAVAQKYDKNCGLGTIISSMLPYSLFFAAGWTVQLIIWYIFNLPLGPGANMFI